MTQHDLATAAGVSQSTISNAERGDPIQWRRTTAMEIYRALSSKAQLDFDEQAEYMAGTGLKSLPNTLLDDYPSKFPVSQLLPDLLESQRRDFVALLNLVERMYVHFGPACATTMLRAAMSIGDIAGSDTTLEWRKSWQEESEEPRAAGPARRKTRYDPSSIPEPGAGQAPAQRRKHG